MRRSVRLLATAAAVALGVLGASAVPAAAEEQPTILKAYGLDWIERVRDDAWPQPKEQRPIICLLDTGVAVTPDTPDDNPLGPIVARLALDGGTGLPQGGSFEHLHGTDMASVIAAPRNGYGTVGVFPQARIVSVRVTEGEETFITPRAVAIGAGKCAAYASQSRLRVASIVMAESFYDQRPADLDVWRGASGWATAVGALFVAAVGNSPGAQTVAPIAVADVLSVAAGDLSGSLCGFAQYPAGVAALGPGCSEGEQWPSGSSSATAAIGALVAAAVSREPSLGSAQVRAWLEGDAKADAASIPRFQGYSLAARLFAGFVEPLSSESAAGISGSPAQSGSDTKSLGTSAAPPLPVRLWRPTVIAKWTGGFLKISRTDRRTGGTLTVRFGKGQPSPRRFKPGKRSLRIRAAQRPRQIEVWVEGKNWRSLSRRARVLSS